jgi:hypothetical protein
MKGGKTPRKQPQDKRMRVEADALRQVAQSSFGLEEERERAQKLLCSRFTNTVWKRAVVNQDFVAFLIAQMRACRDAVDPSSTIVMSQETFTRFRMNRLRATEDNKLFVFDLKRVVGDETITVTIHGEVAFTEAVHLEHDDQVLDSTVPLHHITTHLFIDGEDWAEDGAFHTFMRFVYQTTHEMTVDPDDDGPIGDFGDCQIGLFRNQLLDLLENYLRLYSIFLNRHMEPKNNYVDASFICSQLEPFRAVE